MGREGSVGAAHGTRVTADMRLTRPWRMMPARRRESRGRAPFPLTT
jgi:hypothetical protein